MLRWAKGAPRAGGRFQGFGAGLLLLFMIYGYLLITVIDYAGNELL